MVSEDWEKIARNNAAGVTAFADSVAPIMARHDAEARRTNHSHCGCDYCAALRPVLLGVRPAIEGIYTPQEDGVVSG